MTHADAHADDRLGVIGTWGDISLSEGANDGSGVGDGSGEEEELGTAPVTPRYTSCGWESIIIYIILFNNVLALGIGVVPLIAKTEEVVSNTAFEITSQSAFVIATAQLINAATKFSTSKAVSGLSDYMGRKPVCILASIMFTVGRLFIVTSKSAGMLFVGAFINGLADVILPVAQAWLCDLLENSERGKSFGILAGFGFGFGFAIGLPMGGVIAQKVSTDAALWISTLLPACNAVLILFCNVPDTYGIVDTAPTAEVAHRYKAHKRRFPPDFCRYLYEQNPLSAFHRMKMARLNPWDWGSYVFGEASFKIYQILLILFLQDILSLTQAQAGITLCLVGLLVAVICPLLLGRYTERPLFFNGLCVQLVAYALLSISGMPGAGGLRNLTYPALFLWSLSVVWISAMQALLTMQYPTDVQGEVLGVIQQLGELCVVLAYPVGILFSYTLKSEASIKFPGIVWACAVGYIVIAVSIQLYSVPIWTDLYVMLLRPKIMTQNQRQQKEEEVDTANIELTSMNPVHAIKNDAVFTKKI